MRKLTTTRALEHFHASQIEVNITEFTISSKSQLLYLPNWHKYILIVCRIYLVQHPNFPLWVSASGKPCILRLVSSRDGSILDLHVSHVGGAVLQNVLLGLLLAPASIGDCLASPKRLVANQELKLLLPIPA